MDGFRRMVKGWLGKALLALLAIPFVFVGMESYFSGGASQSVADVDGVEIPSVVLDQAVENQRQQLLSRRGTNAYLSPEEQAKLRDEVLNNLVERQLMLASAEHAGYQVSDESVQKLIWQTPVFMENGSFSTERYLQVLSRLGETPSSFLHRARQEILLSQQMTGWLMSSFTTPVEFDRLVKLDTEQRDAVVWALPALNYLSSVKVSDAELKAHYDALPSARFTQPERVAVNYMLLSKDRFVQNTEPTAAEVQARYDARLAQLSQQDQRRAAHILVGIDKLDDKAAKAKAESLRAQLEKGADFAALAKANSQDAGSASAGGDLGVVAKGMFVPEFEKALFALNRVDALSPVVKTEFGYHIIKLTALEKVAPPSFESLKSELVQEAKAAKMEEQFLQAVERIDERVYEASELAEVAKDEGLTVVQGPLMERRGGTGPLAEAKVIEVAFSEEQTKDARISGAITLADGRALWLQVSEYKPTRQQTLAEVRDVLRNELLIKKSKAAAFAQAKALAAKPESAWGLAGTPLRVTGLPRQGKLGVDPSIASVVFLAKAPHNNQPIWTALETAQGAALVQVTRVSQAEPPSAEMQTQLRSMMAQSSGQYEMQAIISALRENAKIRIKPVASAE